MITCTQNILQCDTEISFKFKDNNIENKLLNVPKEKYLLLVSSILVLKFLPQVIKIICTMPHALI